MTTYAVGDIQGCFPELRRLLAKVDFSPSRDTLWSVGDLVNRGPDNLGTLRWFYKNRDSVRIVLGNHDLHLIALSYGAKKPGKSDNLSDVLESRHCPSLIAWLRQQPLLHREGQFVMTHAGVPSIWSAEQAARYAAEVEETLRGESPERFLKHMYGNQPKRWSNHLRGMPRLRAITNYLTRMRFCTAGGDLDHRNKGPALDSAGELNGATLKPWFAHRQPEATSYVFGHWASLMGTTKRDDIIGLDTGCVWGGELTLMNLDTGERISQMAIR